MTSSWQTCRLYLKVSDYVDVVSRVDIWSHPICLFPPIHIFRVPSTLNKAFSSGCWIPYYLQKVCCSVITVWHLESCWTQKFNVPCYEVTTFVSGSFGFELSTVMWFKNTNKILDLSFFIRYMSYYCTAYEDIKHFWTSHFESLFIIINNFYWSFIFSSPLSACFLVFKIYCKKTSFIIIFPFNDVKETSYCTKVWVFFFLCGLFFFVTFTFSNHLQVFTIILFIVFCKVKKFSPFLENN